jgi:hypothetical protein
VIEFLDDVVEVVLLGKEATLEGPKESQPVEFLVILDDLDEDVPVERLIGQAGYIHIHFHLVNLLHQLVIGVREGVLEAEDVEQELVARVAEDVGQVAVEEEPADEGDGLEGATAEQVLEDDHLARLHDCVREEVLLAKTWAVRKLTPCLRKVGVSGAMRFMKSSACRFRMWFSPVSRDSKVSSTLRFSDFS